MHSRQIRPPSAGRAEIIQAGSKSSHASLLAEKAQSLTATSQTPVPATIQALGSEGVKAFREGYREANDCGLRMASHASAAGKPKSLSELIADGQTEAAIIEALPSAQTDSARQAAASWRRHAANLNRLNGFDDQAGKRSIGHGWDKVVARHNKMMGGEG